MPAQNLTFNNISKHYKTAQGELTVLDGVTLTIHAGETVAIVGPSGSGKSTLLNIAGSLDKPTIGTVHLGETDITALSGTALATFRATEVGFIFQDHHLLPQLTALENVQLPTIATAQNVSPLLGERVRVRAQRTSEEENSQAQFPSPTPDALLDRLGIAHRAHAFPAQMSGGERQRVAIARALINGAGLLLCDEPTGNLDRAAGENIISLLLELASEQGATVIMVTHNTAHAARFSRCLEIADGKLLETGAGDLR